MLTEGMYIADRYEILGKVGAGGMSDVYKAKDLTLGRFVAIKVLKAEFSEDINFVTKFRSEALAAQLSYSIASGFSTNYINMSIFLAFAVMYPDMQVMLYFIIPIKMKWMAIVYAVLTLYEFIVSGWAGRVAIFMSLLNFIIFFFSTRNFKRYSPHEIHRRQQFKSQMRQPRPGSGITKHKCAICGRTELDDPNLEFRFCSKCDGNYEYCQDHLFTHKHIKKG